MPRLLKALCSPLLTRVGILTLLLLSLAAVSFPQSESAKAGCGTCWWAIGCQCWTCSQSNPNTACTLNPGNGGDCLSGGRCTDPGGGYEPEQPPEN